MRVEELAKTLDHTLLSPRITRRDVEWACEEARDLHLAAVCTFPTFVPLVAARLRGSDVRTCTVVDFPFGAGLPAARVAAAKEAVGAGANEIDVSMNVPAMLSGDFTFVRDDLARVVGAARAQARTTARGDVIVKVIIEAPLLDDKLTRLACKIVADSGADFAKTASGVGTVARVQDVELMREALPLGVGVKASGGIRTLSDTQAMIDAGAARVGSSAATEIVREMAATARRR
jgi:deoxyribose-phosphate aldolase